MANSVELQQQQTEMPQLLLPVRAGHSTHGRLAPAESSHT